MDRQTFVAVVDDDESVRESIPALLGAYGYRARAFASAEQFLAAGTPDNVQCVILDVAMPGMSGPELFRDLLRRQQPAPVIFITAHGNDDLCSQLVAEGAAACLYKPFDPLALLEALRSALPGN